MRLGECRCGARYYVRIPRKWWMRLFMGRRLHYGCDGCGVTLFIPPPDNVWDPEATIKPRHASDLARVTAEAADRLGAPSRVSADTAPG